MHSKLQANFSIKGWDENTWDGRLAKDVSGAKLTHADVKYSYAGGIEGESHIQYLMTYGSDGATGSFVALEHISGSIGGKTGSFVLQHTGTFDAQGVNGKVIVVPQSGTGQLQDLRGSGSYDLVGHQESYPLHLDYELPA